MKKIVAIIMAALMLCSLAACGMVGDGGIQNPADVVPDAGKNNEPVTIQETVLLDESGVKITAKSFSVDSFWGPEVKLLIENNSGKDLTFQCRNSSVNGYMVDTLMSADVADGKKANDTLTFLDADLEMSGITEFAQIEFAFHIFTTEDWETYLDSDQIQLNTSIADTYQQPDDLSGQMAYDANGIKIVVKGLKNDDFFGPSIVVYIENNTDEPFVVQTEDQSVNGFMISAIFSCEVMPGKKAVDTITFMSTDLEENEIKTIEEIELVFNIFNMETWEDIVDTDIVKISFQ